MKYDDLVARLNACIPEVARGEANIMKARLLQDAAAAIRDLQTMVPPDGWREDDPPEDGTYILAANIGTMRWTSYKTTSEQFRRGIKGRWQRAGEYGGWDNAGKPTVWRFQTAAALAAIEEEK